MFCIIFPPVFLFPESSFCSLFSSSRPNISSETPSLLAAAPSLRHNFHRDLMPTPLRQTPVSSFAFVYFADREHTTFYCVLVSGGHDPSNIHPQTPFPLASVTCSSHHPVSNHRPNRAIQIRYSIFCSMNT